MYDRPVGLIRHNPLSYSVLVRCEHRLAIHTSCANGRASDQVDPNAGFPWTGTSHENAPLLFKEI